MIKRALFPFAGLLLLSFFLFPASHVSAHVSAASSPAKPAGGFVITCFDINVLSHALVADCTNKKGITLHSTLDLDAHIGNNNGNLVLGARFSVTCIPSGDNSFGVLFAQCRTKAGNFHSTNFDLDPHVTNDNGHLRWG